MINDTALFFNEYCSMIAFIGALIIGVTIVCFVALFITIALLTYKEAKR